MWLNRKSVTINTISKNKEANNVPERPPPAHWNQSTSALVCCIGFIIIFGLMLFYTIQEIKEESQFHPEKQVVHKYGYTYLQKCALYETCSISCENIGTSDNLTQLVHKVHENFPEDCGDFIKKLFISNVKFPDSILYNDWLYSSTLKIEILMLKGSNIEDIEDDAFHNFIFRDTTTFIIEDISLNRWRDNALKGMFALKIFSLRNSIIMSIEENSFSSISDSISHIQIQQMTSAFNLQNITGTNDFGNIILADFRYNNLKNISANIFHGISSCVQLYLSDSGIQYIEEGAFTYMKKLETLDLSFNKLKYLSSNSLQIHNNKLKLYIRSNLWECTCQLQWLKDLIYRGLVKDNVTCQSPLEVYDKPFEEVEFCYNETTQQTTLTAAMSTLTVIPYPSTPIETFIEIVCHIMHSTIIHTGSYLDDSTENALIASQTVNFTIYDIAVGTVCIDFQTDQANMHILIWFSGYLDSKNILLNASVGCITNLTSGVRIEKLNAGEPYTFCVLKEAEKKISPFNCRAHITSIPWSLRAFLRNEDIPAVAGIVSVSLIVFMLIGAIVVFIVVRRNPSLLRGSKRIVMVKHRTAEALVLPPNVEDCERVTNDNTQKPIPCKRSTLRRSVSETSVFSGRSVDASYVSAAEPTAVQLLHWRLERLRNSVETSSHSARTIPPPLPPRCPKRLPCSPPIPIEFDSLSGISEV